MNSAGKKFNHLWRLCIYCRLQDQTDAMLQMQLIVPSMKTDASITATLKNSEDLVLEIKSDVKLPATNSVQAVVFKYGMIVNFLGL